MCLRSWNRIRGKPARVSSPRNPAASCDVADSLVYVHNLTFTHTAFAAGGHTPRCLPDPGASLAIGGRPRFREP